MPDEPPAIAGIPWRDWVPSWRQPTVCEVDGCDRSVERVAFADLRTTWHGGSLTYRAQTFACAEHGDQLEAVYRAAAAESA